LARLEAGLAYELAQGNLTAPSGSIPIFTAPYALADKITFPCVSVHMDDTGPSERFIGEDPGLEFIDENGNIVETEGWIANFGLTIVGTTNNLDERIALRKALRRIIQANLPIFADAGMILVTFSQTDVDDFQKDNVTLFMSVGKFTCQAPAGVTNAARPLTSTSLTATIGTDTVNG
jgi:hypothetical protein